MSDIQFYWDGNSGVCTYGSRKKFFTEKPSITGLDYDTITYSDGEIALKVLANRTTELTESEQAAIKLFCDAYATDAVVESQSVGEHNADNTSHHDIRVELSNLNQYAHKIATVWSCEADLSTQEGSLNWQYILGDLNDCTDAEEDKWVCPVTESYDVTLLAGLEGVDTTSDVKVTVQLQLNGSDLVTKEYTVVKATQNIPTLSIELVGQTLNYKDKLTVLVSTDNNTGVLVPSRTFLVVDNHGSTMAKRQAMYFYNTLGNHIYYKGYDLTLTGDSQGAQVIASKWDPEIYLLT